MVLQSRPLKAQNRDCDYYNTYNGLASDLGLSHSQKLAWLIFTQTLEDVVVGLEGLDDQFEAYNGGRPSFVETCEYSARNKRILAAMAHKLSVSAHSLYPQLSLRQRTHLDLFLRSHPVLLNSSLL